MVCLPAQSSLAQEEKQNVCIVLTPTLYVVLVETIAVHFPYSLSLSSCALSLSWRADYRAHCQTVIYGRCLETLM